MNLDDLVQDGGDQLRWLVDLTGFTVTEDHHCYLLGGMCMGIAVRLLRESGEDFDDHELRELAERISRLHEFGDEVINVTTHIYGPRPRVNLIGKTLSAQEILALCRTAALDFGWSTEKFKEFAIEFWQDKTWQDKTSTEAVIKTVVHYFEVYGPGDTEPG